MPGGDCLLLIQVRRSTTDRLLRTVSDFHLTLRMATDRVNIGKSPRILMFGALVRSPTSCLGLSLWQMKSSWTQSVFKDFNSLGGKDSSIVDISCDDQEIGTQIGDDFTMKPSKKLLMGPGERLAMETTSYVPIRGMQDSHRSNLRPRTDICHAKGLGVSGTIDNVGCQTIDLVLSAVHNL